MDKGTHTYEELVKKYEDFHAPAFEVTIGTKKLDTAKIQFSSITVDIDAGADASGCSFTIESQYDYANSKWNNELLATVKVGEKLIIKAGYVKREEVFYGFIDDFTINFTSKGAPSIAVTGIDAKGFLMNANDKKYMSQKKTQDVIKEILNVCVSKGYAKKITVGSIANYNAELIQEDMDDYHFLCFIAQNFGMSFFVVDGEIVFDNLMKDTKTITTLTLGTSLIEFTRRASLRNIVGKVVVYGIDPITMKPIKGEANNTSDGGTGDEAGDIAPKFEGIVHKETSMFVQTAEECKRLAQERFNELQRNFISGTGRCLGIPELIPGRYIELKGLDNKSSDKYFIHKVTHEYSDDGYYTTFHVKGAKSK